MSRLPINIGSAINAGDGEAIRNAFDKINQMMAEIYAILAANGIPGSFLTTGDVPLTKLTNIATGNVLANLTGSPSAPQSTTLAALATALPRSIVEARSSASSIVAADVGKTIDVTGTWTLALTAAATLGSGFSFNIRNVGTGVVTIDPNSAETIDGFATLTIPPKANCVVTCDGSTFRTIGLASQILLGSGNVSATQYMPIALGVGYDSYRIILRNIEPVTAGASLVGHFANDGVPNYITSSAYRNAGLGVTQSAAGYAIGNGAGTASSMGFNYQQAVAAGQPSQFDLLLNPAAAGRLPSIAGTACYVGNGVGLVAQVPSNGCDTPGRVTHIRFSYSSGNISNCDWELYGLRK